MKHKSTKYIIILLLLLFIGLISIFSNSKKNNINKSTIVTTYKKDKPNIIKKKYIK